MSTMGFTTDDRAALVALRRDLHRQPELSWQETRTQARLEGALREFGISDVRHVARTGLIARIRGKGAGETVAVRGDMDALPITEATGLEYSSQHSGVMHACGHDVHATWAVGAARLLAQSPAEGDVLIVLQPAEEVGQGAAEILKSGMLDGVQAIFGGHVDRRFEVGTIVAQAGPLAASSDVFTIKLIGRGGHGARPHLTNDPVVAASALVLDIQSIISRRVDPGAPAVITVASIHGGDAPNVIPATVELSGTIRTLSDEAHRVILRELANRVAKVAEAHGLQCEFSGTHATPVLNNSPDAAAWATQAARTVLGQSAVVPLGFTNMASEDFAFYLEKIRGCFLRVGARRPGTNATGDVHTPTFAPSEDAIFVGAAVLAESARVASRSLRQQ